MVPMHGRKAERALHEPTQARTLPRGSRPSPAFLQFPSWEGLGVGSGSQCIAKKRMKAFHELLSALLSLGFHGARSRAR